MSDDKLYLEDNAVSTFFIGDLIFFLHHYQAFFRNIKFNLKPKAKMLMMANVKLFPFVNDFVDYFIDLPEAFKEIGKYQCGYESVSDKESIYTDPEAYASLLNYFRTFYNKESCNEGFAPRGVSGAKIAGEQLYCSFKGEKLNLEKPIVSVFVDDRINKNVWREVIEYLANSFIVAVGGTSEKFSCTTPNTIQLLNYTYDDKYDKIITYMSNSILNVSVEGPFSHVSMFVDKPNLIVGKDKLKFENEYNPLKKEVAFRQVPTFSMVDEEMILADISNVLSQQIAKGI